jgi:hypothetical protein
MEADVVIDAPARSVLYHRVVATLMRGVSLAYRLYP